MPVTYEPIATQTLGTAAANITFNSIPGTFTDIRLVIVTTADAGGSALFARYNSDTATNYSRTWIVGNATAGSSNNSNNQDRLYLGDGNFTGVSATIPTLMTLDIFNYAGSTFKTSLGFWAGDRNGSGVVQNDVGLWRSTSAITSITLGLQTANFPIGSTATLYGILKA